MVLNTLCYITQDDCYLLLHRIKKKNDVNHDKWIGLGGKFEDGESPEDCILREVKEESGLTLTSYKFRGLVTFVSDEAPTEYMHLFSADAFEGELIDSDEGKLEWVPKERFVSLPQWEGDKVFLKLLEDDVPFFSLKLRYEGERLAQTVLNGEVIDASAFLAGRS